MANIATAGGGGGAIKPDEHPDYDGEDTNSPYTGTTDYEYDPVSDTDQPIYVPSTIPDDDDDDDGGGGGGSSTPDTIEDEVIEEEIPEDPWTLPEHKPVPIPGYDPNAIPKTTVPDAPAYEKSDQQKEWEEMYGGELVDIIKNKGLGIPKETQALMKQQVYDTLRAKESENIRLLRDNMEQRGITDSGLLFSEESKIRAATTRGLAASVTEISIKSAFMKMASFENALGQASNFLGYLSQESQLAYAPKLETYRQQRQSDIVRMQGNIDIYKQKLQQAYNVNNMYTQQQLTSELNEQIHQNNIEIAEMEIEAANEAAKASSSGNIIGMILGGLFRWLLPF